VVFDKVAVEGTRSSNNFPWWPGAITSEAQSKQALNDAVWASTDQEKARKTTAMIMEEAPATGLEEM
jgi:hypothetical protein